MTVPIVRAALLAARDALDGLLSSERQLERIYRASEIFCDTLGSGARLLVW